MSKTNVTSWTVKHDHIAKTTGIVDAFLAELKTGASMRRTTALLGRHVAANKLSTLITG